MAEKDDVKESKNEDVSKLLPIELDTRYLGVNSLGTESNPYLFPIYESAQEIQRSVKLTGEVIAKYVDTTGNVAAQFSQSVDFSRAVANVANSIVSDMQAFNKKSVEIIDTAKFYTDVLGGTVKSIKNMRNDFLALDLQPIKGLIDDVNQFQTQAGRISSVINDPYEGIELKNHIFQETEIGALHVDTTSAVLMRVENLELKLDVMQYNLREGLDSVREWFERKIVPALQEDSKNKDAMLEELLSYHREGNKTLVRIKSVEVKRESVAINGNDLEIKRDTNEMDLCSVILRNEASLKRTWKADEIAEDLGIPLEETKAYRAKMYQAARQINNKVGLIAGLPNLLIYSTKSVQVNPKYLEKN